MNKHKLLTLALLASIFAGNAYAVPKTIAEWEKCRDSAEESVDFNEVANAGIEAVIITQCGEPPAKEPSKATGIIGMQPYDIVRSKAWKAKFMQITKGDYKKFVERLTVASESEEKGDWITAEGMLPHSGGTESAAIAINIKTGKVYAAMREDSSKLKSYGFDSAKNAPPFLQAWLNKAL